MSEPHVRAPDFCGSLTVNRGFGGLQAQMMDLADERDWTGASTWLRFGLVLANFAFRLIINRFAAISGQLVVSSKLIRLDAPTRN
ncbi:MAG: hypothetical protein JSW48_13435 [Betaproteobacteria bacterium]|nr:MAG: hypothetical protein JSW48_13435 [Betaproteobacteria bacterium]